MRRPLTLRTRVTLLALLAEAVVVALLVGAFNVVLQTSLDRDVNRTLRSKAAAAVTTTSVRSGRVEPIRHPRRVDPRPPQDEQQEQHAAGSCE